jgi:hypothetical protein
MHEGKCKKDTLNENLSMVMYALVHKLQQKNLKINPNYEKEENYKPHLFNFQLLQNL